MRAPSDERTVDEPSPGGYRARETGAAAQRLPTTALHPRKKRTRRVKPALARQLNRLLCWLLPPVYGAYMWLVYKTSRVVHENTDLLWLMRQRYGGLVGIMWHQEVFMVAWAFRQYEGHTLASPSEFGNIITALLQKNGFVVFRGGSTDSHSRRRRVLPDMIRHMREVPGVAFGITCDGSKGPPYKVKEGSIAIAHACAKPMILSRTWCKRRINLPGWDRSYIPLPFNHIVQAFAGPYFVPVDADDPVVLERFRAAIESELLELTHYVDQQIGEVPAEPRFGFPVGWKPAWGNAIPTPSLDAPASHPALQQRGAEPQSHPARRHQRHAVARQA
ncbi:MAG: lysophospholipid acyltransferase family protein [Candidatus Binatia bacterium]